MHKILVPIEGSDQSLKALRIACDLAAKYDGSIALLYVLAEGKGGRELLALKGAKMFGPELRAALQEADLKGVNQVPNELRKKIGSWVLEQAASKVRRLDIAVEILDIEEGDPAAFILMARNRIDASTIVMGSRGVSGQHAATFGSVSQKVFEKADCTCLSVK